MPDACPDQHRTTILVVEDDRLMRRMMVETLRDHGFDATGVEGAADALDVLGASPGIDLLITDINMPGTSGLDLARRAQEEFPAVHLLVVSGREHLHPGLLPRPAAYLQKPFSVHAFLASARSVLGA